MLTRGQRTWTNSEQTHTHSKRELNRTDWCRTLDKRQSFARGPVVQKHARATPQNKFGEAVPISTNDRQYQSVPIEARSQSNFLPARSFQPAVSPSTSRRPRRRPVWRAAPARARAGSTPVECPWTPKGRRTSCAETVAECANWFTDFHGRVQCRFGAIRRMTSRYQRREAVTRNLFHVTIFNKRSPTVRLERYESRSLANQGMLQNIIDRFRENLQEDVFSNE